MLNPQQKRIATFLAQGLKASQVATIVGVSEGYISQLCSEAGPEGFKEAVRSKAEEVEEQSDEDTLVSAKYLSLEHRILKQIEGQLAFAEIPQLIQALKVVGDRQEKRAARKNVVGLIGQGLIGNNQINVTVLNLPAHAIPEYQVNGQGQVVAVGDRGMSPMNSQAVRQLFKDKKNEEAVRDMLSCAAGNGLEQVARQDAVNDGVLLAKVLTEF